MKPAPPDFQDVILDVAPQSPGHEAGSVQLLDAPRIDTDDPRPAFNWKPTILLVAIGALALLAVAYL